MLDASKFDAHVSIELLRLVRRFYLSLCAVPHERRYVSYLWGKTFSNYGVTRRGVRYKTDGTRMSGDMDTGLGNSLIMYVVLSRYLHLVDITKSVMSVNGDDSVIIIERSDLAKARDVTSIERMGFKIKFEVAFELQDMEFCQCRMVETDYGWVLARSPERILTRTGWSPAKYGRKRIKDYIYSLGMGEMAISYGVPIGHALGKALWKESPTGDYFCWDRKKHLTVVKQKYWGKQTECTISYAARVSYMNAFGITPEEQIHIENSFKVNTSMLITDTQFDLYQCLTSQRIGGV
jgi:hypothetical protein